MKLDLLTNATIHSLSKRVDYLDNGGSNGNGNENNNNVQYWKGKKIIPLTEWKKIADHVEYASHGRDKLRIDEALQYFPDTYNDYLFVFDVPEAYGRNPTCDISLLIV
jgi:hypothetical protein